MKVKHLRERLDELAGILADEAAEDFPSNRAIIDIMGIAKAFSVEARLRLARSEPLTVDDEWLLVAFYNTHLHAEFDEAFRQICEADHDDFGRLYLRAYAFFFRVDDPGQDVAGLIARFRKIMDGMVGDHTVEAILDRLREAQVIVDAPERDDD